MTHVGHVGLKRVMHRFRYTTYVFNKILHMKKEGPYICPTEEQRSLTIGVRHWFLELKKE
jgi:hypothetical protein